MLCCSVLPLVAARRTSLSSSRTRFYLHFRGEGAPPLRLRGTCPPARANWTASFAARPAERMLNRLKGLTDPEAKRKAIGAEFIDVFR